MAQRGRAFTTRASRLALLAVAAMLLLTGLQPRHVAATDAVVGDSRLLAPIADVLSASSWLWATGQDPRRQPDGAAQPLWPFAVDPDGASESLVAPAGSSLVTRASGQFPVSSEPSLAVDPADSDHLVLAVNALDLPSAATYVSHDGGQMWDGPFQAPYFAGDSASLGAPEVVFGDQGALYLVSRSVAVETVAVGLQQLPVERVRITVSRSDDGRNWRNAVSAVAAETDLSLFLDESGLMSGSLVTAFLDSPAIAIGPDPRHPDREIVSIAYTEFRTSFILLESADRVRLSGPATESTIRVIRSSDGGESWSEPVAASETVTRMATMPAPLPAEPGDETIGEAEQRVAPAASSVSTGSGDRVVQGADLAVLANGAVAVAYFDSTRDGPHQGLARVMVAVSTDGARTFGESRQAGLFREIPSRPSTAFFRWWDGSFPRIAVGPEDGLFVVVAARADGQATDAATIQIFRSVDRGEAWDALAPPPGEAGSRFFPAIAATDDGTLFAIWGQLGSDPAGAGYVVQAARWADQGETWTPLDHEDAFPDGMATTISESSANALLGFSRGQYLGGRLGIAASERTVFVAWPDAPQPDGGRLGQQVAFARIALDR